MAACHRVYDCDLWGDCQETSISCEPNTHNLHVVRDYIYLLPNNCRGIYAFNAVLTCS